LFLQQVIALFVLKTGAGFSIFNWIATLAADFLGQSHAGAVFFFDEASTQWFFVGVVRLLFLKSIQSHSHERIR
jgi:CNT family concentrative nucleoside transporter